MSQDSPQKLCGRCWTVKATCEFSKCVSRKDGLAQVCRSCCAISKRDYRDTLKGAVQQLLDSAKRNAKARGKMGRTDAAQVDIDGAYLQSIWDQQKGRCYYLDVPMQSVSGLFQMSLERLNQYQGYIRGNVVLCTLACNTKIQWTSEIVTALIQQHLSGDLLPLIPETEVKVRKKLIKTLKDRIVDGLYSHCTRWSPLQSLYPL